MGPWPLGSMGPCTHGPMGPWSHCSPKRYLAVFSVVLEVFSSTTCLKLAMETAEQERAARDFYNGLSPHERREHFVLSARYRSAYNRILDSEDRTTLPRYFWKKWLPILGAEAAALYVVLRDISRVE